MKKTITKKEAIRRKRTATILDDYNGPCECCGKIEAVFQDSDYAWVCNYCAWTRTDRIEL